MPEEEDNIYTITRLEAEIDELAKQVTDLEKTVALLTKQLDKMIKEEAKPC